ncbi:Hypothetical_protein [Hexamita inflata]|uniref:Hypothetical_protein n=1 Tax=Hexamita inflata TaxID=28002 RepID=A0AA86URA1_9EUKA|nr:Hypothetical protein HINF_LOCUS14561 [Hexamita inflata]CAI9968545.1 Hypothetical protein HINF_LOCUS56190 [Hexamita inflata]
MVLLYLILVQIKTLTQNLLCSIFQLVMVIIILPLNVFLKKKLAKSHSTLSLLTQHVNGSYVLKEKVIKCVSQEFINGDSNNIMYYLTASCSWGGLILGILILLCIWTCCVDWCRCCCCRCLCCQKKEGIVSDSHVYV